MQKFDQTNATYDSPFRQMAYHRKSSWQRTLSDTPVGGCGLDRVTSSIPEVWQNLPKDLTVLAGFEAPETSEYLDYTGKGENFVYLNYYIEFTCYSFRRAYFLKN